MATFKHTWKLLNFGTLCESIPDDIEHVPSILYSNIFPSNLSYQFSLRLSPKYYNDETGEYFLSLLLYLENVATNELKTPLKVGFQMSILNSGGTKLFSKGKIAISEARQRLHLVFKARFGTCAKHLPLALQHSAAKHENP